MMRRKDAPFARPPIERHVYRGWPERQAEAREELKIIHDEGSFGRPVVLADHRFGTIPYICIRGRSSCETLESRSGTTPSLRIGHPSSAAGLVSRDYLAGLQIGWVHFAVNIQLESAGRSRLIARRTQPFTFSGSMASICRVPALLAS